MNTRQFDPRILYVDCQGRHVPRAVLPDMWSWGTTLEVVTRGLERGYAVELVNMVPAESLQAR